MAFLFTVNVIVVTLIAREFCQTEEADTVEMISRGVSSPQEAKSTTEKNEMDSKFYGLKAALTATWLPTVVGDRRHMFIAVSLSTLITKTLILLVSVILAFFFQEEIHSHPFVLWSRVGKIFTGEQKSICNFMSFFGTYGSWNGSII